MSRNCLIADQIYHCFDLYCEETCTKNTNENLVELLNVERFYFSRPYCIDPSHLLAIALFNIHYMRHQYTCTALTELHESVYQIAVNALSGSTERLNWHSKTLYPEVKHEYRLIKLVLDKAKDNKIINIKSDVLREANIDIDEHFKKRQDALGNLVKFLCFCNNKKGKWLCFVDLIEQQILIQLNKYFKSLEFNRSARAADICSRF